MDEPFSALDVLTAETLRTDLLSLWGERQLPIKGIILVTHNIEEAVLMCDRILVFGSNPGRILGEIPVTLPQPRNRLDARFSRACGSHLCVMTRGRARSSARMGRPDHRHALAACLLQSALRPHRDPGRAALQWHRRSAEDRLGPADGDR